MEIRLKQKREIDVNSIFTHTLLNESDKLFLLLICHTSKTKETIHIDELKGVLNTDVYKVVLELQFRNFIEIRNGKLLLSDQFLVKQLTHEEKLQHIAKSIGELNKRNELITYGTVSEMSGISSTELRENKEFSDVIESFSNRGVTYTVDHSGSVSLEKTEKIEEKEEEIAKEIVQEPVVKPEKSETKTDKKERTRLILEALKKGKLTQTEIGKKFGVTPSYVCILNKQMKKKTK
ncbi:MULTISPECIES: hypothetical protein [Bacillus cereus group]|uniref:hypothetical protein n=1 Tax=Bacillus cereus group TaxID=86661 RepID=UPI0010154BF0|nr:MULTISPECIES: hypothetical protein [Bacillus cereus group]MCU5201656.1 hypothetical protein [Bacillus paranthracis]MCU5374684.1 hypothetical protein [Bacillus pacificus]GCF76362.1 hypothetical protein BC2926_39030 [Bacillus cereus]